MRKTDWDLVIKPRSSLFNLNLKEIWHYKDLVVLFVKRDFVSPYKQTILGPDLVFYPTDSYYHCFCCIFGNIAKIPTDGITAGLFYMSGITLWNYFSACLTSTIKYICYQMPDIFGKVYFPSLVLPLSKVISNIIKFGIQFDYLLLAMILVSILMDMFIRIFSIYWIFTPVLILFMAGIGLGLGHYSFFPYYEIPGSDFPDLICSSTRHVCNSYCLPDSFLANQ